MGDFDAYLLTGTNNPARQVSLTFWNGFVNKAAALLASTTRIALTRDAMAAAAFPALPVILLEGRRSGLFLPGDYAGISALVDADATERGIYVRSTFDVTKAFTRLFDSWVNPQWWGIVPGNAAGANGAANTAARTAMMACLKARGTTGGTGTAQGLDPIRLPAGYFEFSTLWTLLEGTTIFEGATTGFPAVQATTLKFPTGVGAFRTSYATSNDADGAIVAGHMASSGMLFRNLCVQGGYNGTDDAAATDHGFELRSRATFENVLIRDFGGDGYHADARVSAAPQGNVNGVVIRGGRIQNCRNGIWKKGADTNTWKVNSVDFAANRAWGVSDSNDQTSLESSYEALELATNGTSQFNDGIICGSTQVFYGIAQGGTLNGRYGVIAGQEAWASANPPSGNGTDNQGWYFAKAQAAPTNAIPTWFLNMKVRAGGSVYGISANASTSIRDSYSEGDQGLAQVSAPMIIHGGGLAGQVWKGSTGQAVRTNTSGNSLFQRGVGSLSYTGTVETMTVVVGEPSANYENVLSITGSVTFNSTLRFQVESGDFILRYGNATTIFTVTGPTTTLQFGTGAAVPYAFVAPLLMIGSGGTNGRLMTNGTAAPTTGTYGRGSICWNRNMAVGSPIGWACTTTGTPGTWVAMVNL